MKWIKELLKLEFKIFILVFFSKDAFLLLASRGKPIVVLISFSPLMIS